MLVVRNLKSARGRIGGGRDRGNRVDVVDGMAKVERTCIYDPAEGGLCLCLWLVGRSVDRSPAPGRLGSGGLRTPVGPAAGEMKDRASSHTAAIPTGGCRLS